MNKLIGIVFLQVASCASILGLYFSLNPPGADRPWWHWVLVTITAIITLFLIVREIGDYKSLPKIFKSKNEVDDYVRKWISSAGRVAIFSRDMSWAGEQTTADVLFSKARRNELTVFIEHDMRLTDELRKAGAKVITYGKLNHIPRSTRLRPLTSRVVGIDPSAKSIAIARANCGETAEFVQITIEDYAEEAHHVFDVVVANMVLMDVLELGCFLDAVCKVLRPGGALIFSCTHPWFWPSYYGYASSPGFRYDREIVIEGPYRITADPECALVSTHVHRPLESYISSFRVARLFLTALHEPMPSPEIDALYPLPWKYPRYMFGICRLEPERMQNFDF